MLAAPLPVDEEKRINLLHNLHVLDTGQDRFLQSLMALVKDSFGVETALISLVDTNRQWFKAKIGLEANSTGRDISFCGHAILNDSIFEISDARDDDRFKDNPLVTEAPFIRFYAGYPLLNDAELINEQHAVKRSAISTQKHSSAIGTLCVISSTPKVLTEKERNMLSHFGHIANGYLVEKYAHFFSTPSHSFQQALANCHDQLIAVLDESGQLCFANERFKTLLLNTEAPFKAKINGLPLIDSESHTLHAPTEQDCIYTLETCDGQSKYVNISYTSFQRTDNSSYVLMAIKDITDIQRSLDLLRKSNKELDNFTYIASHDLKSPLNAIGKLAGWIKEDIGDDLNEAAEKHLNLLTQRSNRMMALLDDLLEYSRVGRVNYKPSQTSLLSIFERIINTVDIEGSITCNPLDMPMTIEAIPFATVMRNLIQNSAKHCDKSTCLVHIDVKQIENIYQITIADNGPGIPEHLIPKALQVFQTLRPRDQVEGTGIGLSLVKKIVQLHAGELLLRNNPEGGLVVQFTWPIKQIESHS